MSVHTFVTSLLCSGLFVMTGIGSEDLRQCRELSDTAIGEHAHARLLMQSEGSSRAEPHMVIATLFVGVRMRVRKRFDKDTFCVDLSLPI